MDGTKRILLVADSEGEAAEVRASLEASPLGREIVWAGSLGEATKALRRSGFEAILLNTCLSGCPAVDAVKRLLKTAQDTPILVITDAADVPEAIDAVRQGAQDYVLKSSFSDGALGHRLQFCIERFRQARDVGRQLVETRKLKARFESLMRDNADAILVLDMGGRVKFANPAAGSLFDRDPGSLIGTDPGIPIENAESMEIAIGKRNGIDTVLDIRVMKTYWDDEQVFLATLRDISLRKRTERALVLAKQQAELASEMKSKFLANMSHELRTPLNSILGFAEMMQQGVFGHIENPRYTDYITTIRQSGAHLLTLINNLLDLSKIEAGHEELDEETVDIFELLHAAAHAAEPTAREHGITLTCEVDSQPHLLRADHVRLDQIVLNLLSNAIKFTPRGGRVILSGRAAVSGGYEITVVDTGCGMDPADIPQAMGSFAQIRNPYLRKRDRGTGLGLPIARGLVELHEGRMEIASRRGRGTRVTVLLPADRVIDDKVDRLISLASAHRNRHLS